MEWKHQHADLKLVGSDKFDGFNNANVVLTDNGELIVEHHPEPTKPEYKETLILPPGAYSSLKLMPATTTE